MALVERVRGGWAGRAKAELQLNPNLANQLETGSAADLPPALKNETTFSLISLSNSHI